MLPLFPSLSSYVAGQTQHQMERSQQRFAGVVSRLTAAREAARRNGDTERVEVLQQELYREAKEWASMQKRDNRRPQLDEIKSKD